jgi:chemotaxis protein MotB
MTYRPGRRRRISDHGIDDWLMTYADMITLLLCFFAVFLSVSVPKTEVFEQARRQVLEEFSDVSDEDVIELSQTGDPHANVINNALPSFVDRHHTGEGNLSSEGFSGSDGNKRGHKPPPPQPAGDRIITMEIPSAAFFSSGSTTLSEEGKRLLRQLRATNLRPEIIEGYVVTIEGHTDDSPINTAQFPSNWELSTGRAAAVVRYLIENGIPPQQLRAAGYGDTFPKFPNRDAFSQPIPTNQQQNRRVVIKLEKIEKAPVVEQPKEE